MSILGQCALTTTWSIGSTIGLAERVTCGLIQWSPVDREFQATAREGVAFDLESIQADEVLAHVVDTRTPVQREGVAVLDVEFETAIAGTAACADEPAANSTGEGIMKEHFRGLEGLLAIDFARHHAET